MVLDYITPLDHTCYAKIIMPGILLIRITMALLCAVELYQFMPVENWALCKNSGTETKLEVTIGILTMTLAFLEDCQQSRSKGTKE